jgi:lipopolysaccharide/colanic/teichoic acid biosynthesis glycosyltransferase
VQWNEPTVDDTARVIGPVALHGGAVVEEDALIVGPATIGAGAVVGRGAVVAQSLVASGASVAPGTTVRHRVVTSHQRPSLPAPPRTQSDPQAIPVRLRDESRSEPRYLQAKALVEPILASLALLLLSPLMIVIGLLVKLTSRGPVLYGDSREGKDGRVFQCWKFRTMIKGAPVLQRGLYAKSQVDGPQFKLANDPRITAIGSWLRPSSLDELPQLINVAHVQMSLVGPRPSPFRENQTCIPWRQGRLSVRPGITGLWQVCRNTRAAGDFHQWIYYDLLYIRNASLLVDLKIIAATVLTLGGRGHVPLSWIIAPERYSERRLARRDSPALTIRRLWTHA